MPNVSVIIPTYNRALTVGKAIDSVLQQTYDDLEIIVIDDGSTDTTYETLRPYLQTIRYVYKKNGGISSARNRGLEIAQGEYIALLDSDDLWMPEKLQRQMDCFTDCPEYGLVATRCLTNTVDTRFNTIAIHRIRRSGKSGWIYKDLFYKNFVRTSSVVIQKKCFQEVGVFDEELPRCNDIDMWLRITKKYPVGFLNEPLTIYTRRPKEIRRDNIEGRKIWIQVLEKHYDPDLIPKKLYRRRMARVYGHIAENALKKGEREEVKQFLYQTLLLSPFNLKALKTYVLLHLKK